MITNNELNKHCDYDTRKRNKSSRVEVLPTQYTEYAKYAPCYLNGI